MNIGTLNYWLYILAAVAPLFLLAVKLFYSRQSENLDSKLVFATVALSYAFLSYSKVIESTENGGGAALRYEVERQVAEIDRRHIIACINRNHPFFGRHGIGSGEVYYGIEQQSTDGFQLEFWGRNLNLIETDEGFWEKVSVFLEIDRRENKTVVRYFNFYGHSRKSASETLPARGRGWKPIELDQLAYLKNGLSGPMFSLSECIFNFGETK